MTYETRFGIKLGAAIAAYVAVITLHWWQDSLGEDAAWIWSCHSMGNGQCGPGEPWIKIQIGGTD